MKLDSAECCPRCLQLAFPLANVLACVHTRGTGQSHADAYHRL